ncbi:MAG: HEAT repeat domain-containing protein [Planctomycetes bacterium]|nr:HEAT repeat domain-containing protein [Planctomycetota bacterium]
MRTPACIAVLALAFGAAAASSSGIVVSAPTALAKDKAPEISTAEKDFLAGYTSDDGAARAKAVDRLHDAPEPARLQLVSTRVIPKEKRADVLARAVEVLSRVKDESVIEKIVAASRAGPPEQRCLYVESLASMQGSTAAHKALLEFVRDKETWVRAMSAFALGEHRAMDGFEPLLACLSDKMWQVQSAALAALPRLSDKDTLKSKALPKLVDYLENSSGRQRDDCADALKRISGRTLGKDADVWRKWIAGGDPAIAPPAAPGTGPDAKPAPAPGTPTGGDYGEQQAAEKPHFYGIEVTSTRIVIVLDRSLSMNDPITIDRERLRRETSRRRAAVTGENAPKDDKTPPEDVGYDIPWWRIKTKLDLARYQTINLLSRLAPEQNFEMILFSNDVEPWMSRLVPASQANKQKAIQVVETLKPDGETNTWGALAAAFEMSAAATRTGPGAPDEIYFVTDGQPSKGDILDGNQIYEAVVQLAKVHQMRVNVIGIGVNLTFLRKIAVITGGQYKSFE